MLRGNRSKNFIPGAMGAMALTCSFAMMLAGCTKSAQDAVAKIISHDLAIVTPTVGGIISSSNKAAFPISGSCKVNGVSVTWVAEDIDPKSVTGELNCVDNLWSGIADLQTLSDGTVNLMVTQLEAAGTVASATVALVKNITPPTITITSPSKLAAKGLRGEGLDATDTTFISPSTPSRSLFAINGTCTGPDSQGAAVEIKLDGNLISTRPTSPTCEGVLNGVGGAFAVTVDATSWSNGTHVLTAFITNKGGGTAVASTNSVTMYSWQTASTVSWANDIKPLFANPAALGTGNVRTCLECHSKGYSSTSTSVYTDGFNSHSFGVWAGTNGSGSLAECASGGIPLNGVCQSGTYPAFAATTSTGSNTVTLTSTTGTDPAATLAVGMVIKGSGIAMPAVGFVSSVSTNVVTLVSANKSLAAGMLVTGAGITDGTTVTASSTAGTTVTLSATPTLTAGTALYFAIPAIALTGDLTSGSATVSNLSAGSTKLFVGMPVAGIGIPVGTKILTYTAGATNLTLSANATSAGTGVSLRFSNPTTVITGISGSVITMSYNGATTQTSQTLTFYPAQTLATGSDRANFKYQFGYFDNRCTPSLAPKATTANINTSSTQITVASTVGILPNMKVYGTGITKTSTIPALPYGKVVSVDSTTTFTVDEVPTTQSGASMLSFFPSDLDIDCNSQSVASTFGAGGTDADNFRRGVSIVNFESELTRNKIVRGKPEQSLLYEKTSGGTYTVTNGIPSNLTADNYVPRIGLLSVVNGLPQPLTGFSARMPNKEPNYFSVAQSKLLYDWIMEGARTDN